MSRRGRTRVVALALALGLVPHDAFGQAPSTAPTTAPTTAPVADRIDASVARGLEYLAKRQNPDGSFSAGEHRVAVGGLAVLAFLACGHTPGAGRYGLVVRNGVDYLLSQARPDGYFGHAHGKGMYDQGIVTLALAEAYGVEPDAARRRRTFDEVTRGVKVILDAQAVPKPDPHAGGWRYTRDARDSDISLAGWNALALRAARDAGVDVPKEAVQKAVGFLLKCYTEKERGFSYQPGGNAQLGPTGIGLLGLYLLDGSPRPELEAAGRFLADAEVNEKTRFLYYSVYYVTQAAHQAGGATWASVSGRTLPLLLATQAPDGSWPKAGEEPGEAYATAMAVLTLAVPYRLLPAYQR